MSFRSLDLYNLVQEHGESLTLKKVTTSGSYDPTSGSLSGSATTNYTVVGYFYNYDIMNIDQVRKGARKCVISAFGLSAEPDEGDYISGNGDSVTISSVTTIFSAGTPICYICHTQE